MNNKDNAAKSYELTRTPGKTAKWKNINQTPGSVLNSTTKLNLMDTFITLLVKIFTADFKHIFDCSTLSRRRFLSYRNCSIDSKSMDEYLHDRGLRHERVKRVLTGKVSLMALYCSDFSISTFFSIITARRVTAS